VLTDGGGPVLGSVLAVAATQGRAVPVVTLGTAEVLVVLGVLLVTDRLAQNSVQLQA
jgi:hypothetical protein